MSDFEDVVDSEPPSIDPYETLKIDRKATDDQIKKAYRKAALQHHPDKVPADQKETAHATFQGIVFAYAVLSDPARRKRYDETGSTSESVLDSDGFNWSEYYRDLYKDAVSTDAIEKFAKKYKGSDEEKDDILATYEECEGDMDAFYQTMILSEVTEDDDRYRRVIDEAIENEDVPSFPAYANETKKKREGRVKRARLEAKVEAKEAEDYAKELGVHGKLYGKAAGGKKGKKAKDNSEDALAALIQKNQQKRSSDNFLDNLAEKYGASSKPKKGKKRDLPDEPSEEAFQAVGAKYKAAKAAREKTEPGPRPKRTRR